MLELKIIWSGAKNEFKKHEKYYNNLLKLEKRLIFIEFGSKKEGW